MSEPRRAPFRVRYRVPLAAFPFVVGIATTIALWGERADKIFFSTAAEVIALGAVAMALQGGFFRIGEGGQATSGYAMASILIAVGVGLAFAFGALARQDGGAVGHFALTTGSLAMGVSAFVILAFFGVPGAEDDD